MFLLALVVAAVATVARVVTVVVPTSAAPLFLEDSAGTSYSVVQMNLCLSGLAPCLRYPQVVHEAVRVIRTRRPNAVTLNESCAGDVASIAARTGYHWRFTTVLYRCGPLPCRSPAGRGSRNIASGRERIEIKHGDVRRITAARDIQPAADRVRIHIVEPAAAADLGRLQNFVRALGRRLRDRN